MEGTRGRHAVARRRRALEDAHSVARLTGLPTSAAVPFDPRHGPLPTQTHPQSRRAEAYHRIGAVLTRLDVPAHIVVTSAGTGEGKTAISANVATALAQRGSRVLVIDAHLRRPSLASVFDIPTHFEGLTDYLKGRISWSDAILATDDDLPDVITAGSARTRTLLKNGRFDALVASARHRYDFVVVDLPPVLQQKEALQVAASADGTILVSLLGTTTPSQLTRAAQAMERANVRVLGVMPNESRTQIRIPAPREPQGAHRATKADQKQPRPAGRHAR